MIKKGCFSHFGLRGCIYSLQELNSKSLNQTERVFLDIACVESNINDKAKQRFRINKRGYTGNNKNIIMCQLPGFQRMRSQEGLKKMGILRFKTRLSRDELARLNP